jgi:hypothetical protein
MRPPRRQMHTKHLRRLQRRHTNPGLRLLRRLRARVGTAPRSRSVTRLWPAGQTLMARHCAAPIGPPAPCRPAIPRARSDGRVPRRNRIRIAAGRLARRAGWNVISPSTRVVYHRRRSARRPDSSTIPRAFVGTRCRGPAGRGSPSSQVVPVRIARPAATAGRWLISSPTPIPGISAGQGYPAKVSQDYRDPWSHAPTPDPRIAVWLLGTLIWHSVIGLSR